MPLMSVKSAPETELDGAQIARIDVVEMLVLVLPIVVVVVVVNALVVVAGHVYVSHGQPSGQPDF